MGLRRSALNRAAAVIQSDSPLGPVTELVSSRIWGRDRPPFSPLHPTSVSLQLWTTVVNGSPSFTIEMQEKSYCLKRSVGLRGGAPRLITGQRVGSQGERGKAIRPCAIGHAMATQTNGRWRHLLICKWDKCHCKGQGSC